MGGQVCHAACTHLMKVLPYLYCLVSLFLINESLRNQKDTPLGTFLDLHSAAEGDGSGPGAAKAEKGESPKCSVKLKKKKGANVKGMQNQNTGTASTSGPMWSLKIETLIELACLNSSEVSRTAIVLQLVRPLRQFAFKFRPVFSDSHAVMSRRCRRTSRDGTHSSSCQSSEMKEGSRSQFSAPLPAGCSGQGSRPAHAADPQLGKAPGTLIKREILVQFQSKICLRV